MQEESLARRLGRTKEEASELMKVYMERYPAVQAFFKEAVEEAMQHGYAWTVLGRRRFLEGIVSGNRQVQAEAARQATNTPIQGSAADVVKMAMVRLHYDGKLKERFGCNMQMQVHDELIFECPEEAVEDCKPVIKEYMEHSFPRDLAVPLTISMGVGNNWSETH